MNLPEPWLRGPIAGVHPFLAPILYSFEQAREDLARHTAGLTIAQIWSTSLGFHLRHIGGSTNRLVTYLEGNQLSEKQMAALAAEHQPGASREQLLAAIDASFHHAEQIVRVLDPGRLADPRAVGRQRLPTTVIGLLIHIAEHTQRHVGQAISAAKQVRAVSQPADDAI